MWADKVKPDKQERAQIICNKDEKPSLFAKQ